LDTKLDWLRIAISISAPVVDDLDQNSALPIHPPHE
jgi:hypothetical protein